MSRTQLTASQTIDVLGVLEDRAETDEEMALQERAFRSRRISLSDRELGIVRDVAENCSDETRPDWL